jgi:hypothetical protein
MWRLLARRLLNGLARCLGEGVQPDVSLAGDGA